MNRGLTPIVPFDMNSKKQVPYRIGPPQQSSPSSKIPILVILSYYEGDRDLCRKLCALIADLQPQHVGRACEILLVARQDCEIDKEMVWKLSTRFNLYTFKSTSPQRGWPAGPNGMFGTTMIHIANAPMNVECVFWMEADCAPMMPNWFDKLAEAWKNRRPGASVVGCMFDCDGNGRGVHITGCALYDPNFARILPGACSCSSVAWDYQYRHGIVALGQATNLIGMRFRAQSVEPTILNDPCAVMHGVKNDCLLNLIRDKYVPQPIVV